MINKEKFVIEKITPQSENPNNKYYEYSNIIYDYLSVTHFPDKTKKGMDRYLQLLPVKELRIDLPRPEFTPLSQPESFNKTHGFSNLFIKHEELNSTGCFKDRESQIVISAAIENNIKKVYVISSGNAALSTAAFAQKAGIECVCYIPSKTTEAKKNLIKLFGGQLVLIDGFYEDVYRTVVDMNPDGWNVTTGQNEFREEGDKTIAYELWEQMGGKVPDTIVVPCGNGGNLAGIFKGYKELQILGKINKLPQMVGVQIKKAAPIQIAFQKHKDYVIVKDIEDSIAEGIVAEESYSSPKTVKALNESGGYMIEVTDKEIVAALKSIIKTESIMPEPTSAAAFAAINKLKNKITDNIVVINTGSGNKFLDEIVSIVQK